jgi:hypothetical protein
VAGVFFSYFVAFGTRCFNPPGARILEKQVLRVARVRALSLSWLGRQRHRVILSAEGAKDLLSFPWARSR